MMRYGSGVSVFKIIIKNHLALAVLKHLQGLLHLCFIITQLTQTVTGHQVFKYLSITGQNILKLSQ